MQRGQNAWVRGELDSFPGPTHTQEEAGPGNEVGS